MRLISCPKCSSQFDVSSMTPGTSFVCGQCRHVLQVPEAGPVVQPIGAGGAGQGGGGAAGRPKPPPTVMMSPEQMRKALGASREVAAKKKASVPSQRAAPRSGAGPTARPAAKLPKLGAPGAGRGKIQPPPTTVVPPDEMRRLLAEAGAAPAARPAARPAAARPAAKRPATPAPPAAASAPSPPRLPKAMQKRAASGGADAVKRAGGAQQAQAAAATKKATKKAAKPARAAARRERPERPEKKGGAGLWIGVGIGVIALGAGGFLLLGRGDGATSTTDGGGAGGTPVATNGGSGGGDTGGNAATNVTPVAAGGTTNSTAPAAPLDEFGKFLAMGATDQTDEVTKRLLTAVGDVGKLKGLYDWFYDEKIRSTVAAKTARERIAKEAIKIEPDVDWAQEGLGKQNGLDLVKRCKDECAFAFDAPNDDTKELDEALPDLEKAGWVDPLRFKELESAVAKVRAWNEQLQNDPRLRRAQTHVDFIRKNDLFKDLKFIYRFDDPFVIFQNFEDEDLKYERELDKDGNKVLRGLSPRELADRNKKAALFAKRDGIIFTALHDRYRELFAERFKLPDMRTDEGGSRILRAIILWDQRLAQKWLQAQDSNMPPGVRAYYSPTEKHIVHYVGQDTLTEQALFEAEGGFVQPYADQVTFHEGTHMLMHEYGAIFQGQPLTDGADPVRMRKSMWFGEGIAEFMGAVEVDEDHWRELVDAKFRYNRLLIERIHQWRQHRKNDREKKATWTLARMLEPNNNQDLYRIANEISPGRANWLANIFYAQAWGFVHFAFNYDDGKYKENILTYMEHELAGTNGPEALAKAFGLKSPKEFGKIEDEYWWYANECLNRRTEPDKVTLRRPKVNTDAPTGNMESDSEDPWGDDEDDDEGM